MCGCAISIFNAARMAVADFFSLTTCEYSHEAEKGLVPYSTGSVTTTVTASEIREPFVERFQDNADRH
jgi:hypothetical protein